LLGAACEFADPREFKNGPFAAFFEQEIRFSFGLVFIFPNGSVLSFLDIAASHCNQQLSVLTARKECVAHHVARFAECGFVL
jgi:hypothetical protein